MAQHHRRDPDAPLLSEITPHDVWLSRRRWIRQAALASGGAWASRQALAEDLFAPPGKRPRIAATRSSVAGALVMDKPTPYGDVTAYNNFYEFGTDKTDPAQNASSLKTSPWTVAVEGACLKPRSFDLDGLKRLAPMEDRIYRLRCVEGWSMVVPWVGWSLSQLLKQVEPTGNAKYVEFTSMADASQMPGVRSRVLEWPYTEGLRMDEAMHPLTLLAFGLYGELLPPQNGAPVRLVVPWKYGFKSAKSLVRIRLVEKPPTTSWMRAAPEEYGFYSNVNPQVDHPRWSQATERRIGEGGLFTRKRPTLMFNGYGAQVASLYSGMDLRKYF